MAAKFVKDIELSCPYLAVIPSLTVETTSQTTGLQNSLVHIADINTTVYIDDKFRTTQIYTGPVEYADYDYANNPNNYKGQMVADFTNGRVVYYDKTGTKYIVSAGSMVGATPSADGTSGMVPAPSAGDNVKFLRGDGTWAEPDGGATTDGIAELSTSSYNYPTDNPTSVALWLLEPGYYVTSEVISVLAGPYADAVTVTANEPVLVSFNTTTSANTVVVKSSAAAVPSIYTYSSGGARTNPSPSDEWSVLIAGMVQNALTSDGTTLPLAAAQGRILARQIMGDSEHDAVAEWTEIGERSSAYTKRALMATINISEDDSENPLSIVANTPTPILGTNTTPLPAGFRPSVDFYGTATGAYDDSGTTKYTPVLIKVDTTGLVTAIADASVVSIAGSVVYPVAS